MTNKCFTFFKFHQATTFPKQVTNATRIWIGYKVNLLLTQKWEENSPKFCFCIRAHTFSTHIPWLFKICFTNKINAICGEGQLLVTGHRVPLPGSWVSGSHVSGLQVPRPRVPVPESQCSKSQGHGVLGLRVSSLRVPGPGSQVLILDYANL